MIRSFGFLLIFTFLFNVLDVGSSHSDLTSDTKNQSIESTIKSSVGIDANLLGLQGNDCHSLPCPMGHGHCHSQHFQLLGTQNHINLSNFVFSIQFVPFSETVYSVVLPQEIKPPTA